MAFAGLYALKANSEKRGSVRVFFDLACEVSTHFQLNKIQ